MGETITPKVGVGVLLFRENMIKNQILVGKRLSEHGHGEWSLPGGHVEMMEDLEKTCWREVREETGLIISTYPKKFDSFPYSNDRFYESGKHYITLFFVGEIVGGKLENREPEKCEGWEWVDVDKIPTPMFPPLDKMVEKKVFLNHIL